MDDNFPALLKNIDNFSEIENCSKSKVHLRQWVISINFLLIIMLIGMTHGHTAILLQQLNPNNNTEDIKIENGEIIGMPPIIVESKDFQSWIASVLLLFNCPGCWILTICSKKIGRKPILIMAVATFTCSWFFIAFADNAYKILIGRGLMGWSIGILSGLISVYQGECSMPKLRQIFNAMLSIAFSIGILSCHAIGTWFHWRTTALFCGTTAIITLGLNFFIPESPIWLLRKKRYMETIYSWTFLRGVRDFDELKSMLAEKDLLNQEEINTRRKNKNYCISENKFCTSTFLKPFGILIVLYTVAQLSGMGAVTFYCIEMIKTIVKSDYAHVPTLILDGFRLFSSICLSLCIKRFSTRTLTLLSAFSCSFFLIFIALTTLFEIYMPWFPLILLFCYEASVIMGLSPLPWCFLGELFSNTYKDIGVGMITSFNYILFFVVVKFNNYLFTTLQNWGTFFLYGILTFVGSSILYFILPETKNKTLKEIEMMFISNDKNRTIKK